MLWLFLKSSRLHPREGWLPQEVPSYETAHSYMSTGNTNAKRFSTNMRTHWHKPRRLEAKNRFWKRQVERQAQQRMVEAEKKSTILQNRIARGACSRRERPPRNERLANKNADEWKTAAETARRCPAPDSLFDILKAYRNVA